MVRTLIKAAGLGCCVQGPHGIFAAEHESEKKSRFSQCFVNLTFCLFRITLEIVINVINNVLIQLYYQMVNQICLKTD